MSEADDAVANSISFEAKKDKCAQLQSGGWTLTLKIHPQDVDKELMLAVPGQRYMCALVALGDAEEPLKGKDTVPKKDEAPKADKPKRKFEDMPASQQAGTLCADPEFQRWIVDHLYHGMPEHQRVYSEYEAKHAIYSVCNITSRKQLNEPQRVTPWIVLVRKFRDATRETAEIR